LKFIAGWTHEPDLCDVSDLRVRPKFRERLLGFAKPFMHVGSMGDFLLNCSHSSGDWLLGRDYIQVACLRCRKITQFESKLFDPWPVKP
jgi:hypothetical protein